MTRGKAEDAGGLTPAKDDNAAPYHFDRRTLPIFKCVDYIAMKRIFCAGQKASGARGVTPCTAFFTLCSCLLGHDGFRGAVGGASATVHAGIGVDHILGIALGNRLNGAVLSAGAAADAGIRNLVSHSSYLPIEWYSHCTMIFLKCKGKTC